MKIGKRRKKSYIGSATQCWSREKALRAHIDEIDPLNLYEGKKLLQCFYRAIFRIKRGFSIFTKCQLEDFLRS